MFTSTRSHRVTLIAVFIAISFTLVSCGRDRLLQAAVDGNTDEVKNLINNGSNIETKDADGWTALHFATRYGHKDAVAFLISKGAQINAKDKQGKSPLDGAALKGHKDVVELLKKAKQKNPTE